MYVHRSPVLDTREFQITGSQKVSEFPTVATFHFHISTLPHSNRPEHHVMWCLSFGKIRFCTHHCMWTVECKPVLTGSRCVRTIARTAISISGQTRLLRFWQWEHVDSLLSFATSPPPPSHFFFWLIFLCCVGSFHCIPIRCHHTCFSSLFPLCCEPTAGQRPRCESRLPTFPRT